MDGWMVSGKRKGVNQPRQDHLEHIRSLPLVTPPGVFGFHENANLTKETSDWACFGSQNCMCWGEALKWRQGTKDTKKWKLKWLSSKAIVGGFRDFPVPFWSDVLISLANLKESNQVAPSISPMQCMLGIRFLMVANFLFESFWVRLSNPHSNQKTGLKSFLLAFCFPSIPMLIARQWVSPRRC